MHWFWRAAIAGAIAVLVGILWVVATDLSSVSQGYPWRFDIWVWNQAFWLVEKLGVNPFWQHALVTGIVSLPRFLTVVVVYILLTRFLLQNRPERETRCRKCGYILRGITEPRCPECGEQI